MLPTTSSSQYADTTWYYTMSSSSTLQGVVVAMVVLGAMLGSVRPTLAIPFGPSWRRATNNTVPCSVCSPPRLPHASPPAFLFLSLSLPLSRSQIAVFRFESTMGRRREMLVASVCYTSGGLAQYFMGGRTLDATTAITGMCVARVLYGFGVGFAMHGAPSYIAETAPSSLRGAASRS